MFENVLIGLGIATLSGYILGSVPSGVLVGRLWGKDPRHTGSGRTGGTNVYRTAGLPAAAMTVSLDFLKGYFAIVVAMRVVSEPGATQTLAGALAGLAAILGHNHSVFLRFRGGAGSTPNLGAALALVPQLAVVGLLVSVLVLVGSGFASAASMTLALVLAAGTVLLVASGAPPSLALYGVGQLVLVVWALRPNIARLRAGTERKIEWRAGKSE
jgi:glycerol-3-phosphate acyltransferase PlsY